MWNAEAGEEEEEEVKLVLVKQFLPRPDQVNGRWMGGGTFYGLLVS